MTSASEPINQLPKPSILEKLVQRHSKLAVALVVVFMIVFVVARHFFTPTINMILGVVGQAFQNLLAILRLYLIIRLIKKPYEK